MSAHAMSLRSVDSVDSADPAVQRDASRLAEAVDDSTEVGRMVHSLLSDIGAASRSSCCGSTKK